MDLHFLFFTLFISRLTCFIITIMLATVLYNHSSVEVPTAPYGPHSFVQFSTVSYSSAEFRTVPYSSAQFRTVPHSLKFPTVSYSSAQFAQFAQFRTVPHSSVQFLKKNLQF